MDPKFSNFLLEELRQLLAELENGQQPSNAVLNEIVSTELRWQYDKTDAAQTQRRQNEAQAFD